MSTTYLKIKSVVLLTLFLCLCETSSIFAQTGCFSVYHADGEEKTYKCLEEKDGELSASYQMAKFLFEKTNKEKLAREYLDFALKRKHKKAILYYANLLYWGKYYLEDKPFAMSLYEKIASEGDLTALQNLGLIYFYEKNIEKSEYFLSKAYEQEQAVSGMYLGIIEYGRKNLDKSTSYFKASFESGNLLAYVYLSNLQIDAFDQEFCKKDETNPDYLIDRLEYRSKGKDIFEFTAKIMRRHHNALVRVDLESSKDYLLEQIEALLKRAETRLCHVKNSNR